MSYDVRVSVADWACADGDREIDEFGCRWTFGEIIGWFEPPGVRAGALQRPGMDGSWDARPTLDGRVVGISGSVRASDGPALQAAMDRLQSVLTGPERFGTLVVDEANRGVSRQATVRLNDATLIERHSPDYATFSLSLFAADSRRYSTELHTATTTRYVAAAGATFPVSFPVDFGGLGSGGRLQVFNAGTVDTPCLVSWFGDLTNPRVTHVEQNRTVAARMSLALGQTLVVDTGVPSVLLGNSSRRQTLSSAQFFTLPPGISTLFFDADGGSGSMRVDWRDAW